MVKAFALVEQDKILDKLNPHFVKLLGPEPRIVERRSLSARSLMLHPKRFDIVVKYLYIRFREENLHSSWARELYKEHIRALSNDTFEELDGFKKNIDDYYQAFDQLIDSIKAKGFNKSVSLVPVNPQGVVLDGAHRVAAAAYFDQEVDVVVVDDPKFKADYSIDYFREKKFQENHCDAIALHYCTLNPQAYIVNLFPLAEGKGEEVKAILNKYGQVYYHKAIQIGNQGQHLLKMHLYEGESWLGNIDNLYRGALLKARNSFPEREAHPLRVIVFVCDDPEKVLAAKLEIRQLYGVNNNAVHINDTHREAKMAARMYFNDNSLHFLNHACVKAYRQFDAQFRRFRQWLEKNGHDENYFCIDGSSVLSAYGLREGRDIDFLHHGYEKEVASLEDPLLGSHNAEIQYYPVGKDEIIFNPKYHFYYFGIKFCSLPLLKKMKEKRNETKDKKDLALMSRDLVNSFEYRWAHKKMDLQLRFTLFKIRMKAKIRRRLFKLVQPVRRLANRFKAEEQQIIYEGFTLHYSKNTSIVERYISLGSYEPETHTAIRKVLSNADHPVMLDIGANIGMITLATIRQFPQVKIYAFEPGPHQFSYLKKNIAANKLDPQVRISDKALGEKPGRATFTIHSAAHASGDGFIDTGRAGKSETIDVDVITLDDWWSQQKLKQLDLIKIDVEGAEKWIIEGGRKMIQTLQPAMLLEVNPVNLRNYPFDEKDLCRLLNELDYDLFTFDYEKVSVQNISEKAAISDNFYAFPRKSSQ